MGARPAVDTSTLPALLEERGFEEPTGGFLAYVIAMRFEDGRARIVAERRYDVEGTSEEASTWNPASTVKLYAAIGALRRIHALGYDRQATLTFRGTGEPQTWTLEALVQAAIGPSDNLAYDYLVVFSGFDWLHERLLTPENGFERTALRIPYDKGRWTRLGFSESLRDSPDITVEQDGRTTELPAAVGDAEVACDQGSCTTPAELGETLRRVMLQDLLPDEERLGLRADDLTLLRELLASPRERGTEVVHELRPSFSADAVFFHKAGYADEWFSDNVYIDDPALDRTWVVVLAGRPGRSCLDRVAELLGELLVGGRLDP
ncbi:MAG: serine hydrolase [Deltaproteobacteria bacterium]|nr:serine hydrolase [Deltaproteobacteria bacterium]